MTTFLVLDNEQTEMLVFGLSTATRTQRQAMAEIMCERLERAADGDKEVASWKASRLNNLLFQVSRLERPISRSRATGLRRRTRRMTRKRHHGQAAAARGESPPPLR